MELSNFQKLIRDLYFQKDKKRGIQGTFIWLVEEVGELAHLLKNKELDLNNISQELADIIAWTASIANLLNIDLQKAFAEKYPLKCSKCGQNPCNCLEQ